MGARAASGTLAGSRSGSWVSIHEEAAAATSRACVDTLGSYDPRNSLDRRGVRHRRARLPRPREAAARDGITCAGDSSVREARRREPAVVCQQPSVVRSPQFGEGRRSWPRGRRDYRNRGVAIAGPEQARGRKESCRAQATHAWMWAIATVRLAFAGPPIPSKHDWSCVGNHRIEGRCDLDHRAVARPGGAVISSLPRHALLQLVRFAYALQHITELCAASDYALGRALTLRFPRRPTKRSA
jgi:hypothetical protein